MRQMRKYEISLFVLPLLLFFPCCTRAAPITISEAIVEELKKDDIEMKPLAFTDVTPPEINDNSDYIKGTFSFLFFDEDYPPDTEEDKQRYERDSLKIQLRIPKNADTVGVSDYSYAPDVNGNATFKLEVGPYKLTLGCFVGNQFKQERTGNIIGDSLDVFFNTKLGLLPRRMRRIEAIREAMRKTGLSEEDIEKHISELKEKLYQYEEETLYKKLILVGKQDLKPDASIEDQIEIGSLLYLKAIALPYGWDVRSFKTTQFIGHQPEIMTVYYYPWRISRSDNITTIDLRMFTSEKRNCLIGVLKVELDEVKSQEELDTFIMTVLNATK